jgi:hypothetical protein
VTKTRVESLRLQLRFSLPRSHSRLHGDQVFPLVASLLLAGSYLSGSIYLLSSLIVFRGFMSLLVSFRLFPFRPISLRLLVSFPFLLFSLFLSFFSLTSANGRQISPELTRASQSQS